MAHAGCSIELMPRSSRAVVTRPQLTRPAFALLRAQICTIVCPSSAEVRSRSPRRPGAAAAAGRSCWIGRGGGRVANQQRHPMAYCCSNRSSMTLGGRDEHTHPHGRADRRTPGPARPGPARVTTRAAAARQVALQPARLRRDGAPRAGPPQRGRTTAQIRRTLRDSLTPLGLRLCPLRRCTNWPPTCPVELP